MPGWRMPCTVVALTYCTAAAFAAGGRGHRCVQHCISCSVCYFLLLLAELFLQKIVLSGVRDVDRLYVCWGHRVHCGTK